MKRTNGSLVQIKFRGFSAEIVPPDPMDAAKALDGIERYDPKLRTFDTRVLTLSSVFSAEAVFDGSDNGRRSMHAAGSPVSTATVLYFALERV